MNHKDAKSQRASLAVWTSSSFLLPNRLLLAVLFGNPFEKRRVCTTGLDDSITMSHDAKAMLFIPDATEFESDVCQILITRRQDMNVRKSDQRLQLVRPFDFRQAIAPVQILGPDLDIEF